MFAPLLLVLMTCLQTQAELKRDLHREAKINEQKMEELGSEMVLDTFQRGDSTRSQDLIPAEHSLHFDSNTGKQNHVSRRCKTPQHPHLAI